MYRSGIICALFLCLVACASHSPEFILPDGSQRGLDAALADCKFVAETAGLDASQFGRCPIARVAQAALIECMVAKGWIIYNPNSSTSTNPNTSYTASTEAMPSIEIPPGFIEDDTSGDSGPGVFLSHTYAGPHDTMLAAVWQQNPVSVFGEENFPVPSGFWRYTNARGNNDPWGNRFDFVVITPELTGLVGGLFNETTPDPRWTVFYAVRESVLVGGVGAYVPISSNTRLVLVVTTPLSSQRKDAGIDRGRSLDIQERQTLEAFAGGWIKWMRRQSYRIWNQVHE